MYNPKAEQDKESRRRSLVSLLTYRHTIVVLLKKNNLKAIINQ